MLNYRPNGYRRLGRPLRRLLDEAETGLSKPNSWRIMIMILRFGGRIDPRFQVESSEADVA